MKRNEWNYLAKAMWRFAEIETTGKLSPLIKEMVIKVNKNIEVILNELDEPKSLTASDGHETTNTTSKINFNGFGEF
jgi:hypothetical protein